MAPIRDSLSFKRFIAICAFFFPLIFRPVSRLLVLAVKAVSDPEKNADSIKRINIDIDNIIMSKNILCGYLLK